MATKQGDVLSWDYNGKKILMHTDRDKMFAPLIKWCENHVNPEEKEWILTEYMYMNHDQDGIYCYKNNMTRQSLFMKENGQLDAGYVHTDSPHRIYGGAK